MSDRPFASTITLAYVPLFGTLHRRDQKKSADKRTTTLFAGYAVRSIPNQIQRRARAKRLAVDAAKKIDDLQVPPGNRPEALQGDRRVQHSIRINDQWRICFRWSEGEAWEVEVVDYHKG